MLCIFTLTKNADKLVSQKAERNSDVASVNNIVIVWLDLPQVYFQEAQKAHDRHRNQREICLQDLSEVRWAKFPLPSFFLHFDFVWAWGFACLWSSGNTLVASLGFGRTWLFYQPCLGHIKTKEDQTNGELEELIKVRFKNLWTKS